MNSIDFTSSGLFDALQEASDDTLDACNFGIIGFDRDGIVRRYNRFESQAAGLHGSKAIGNALFTLVAPCMNNFMVAQRFEDAADNETALDDTIDYVLTLRMRPSRVKLRLLSEPGAAMRYVAVQRAG